MAKKGLKFGISKRLQSFTTFANNKVANPDFNGDDYDDVENVNDNGDEDCDLDRDDENQDEDDSC